MKPVPDPRRLPGDGAQCVDDVIALFLRRREQGNPLESGQIIASYPQWEQELTEFFEGYGEMERFAAKLSSNRKALMHWASPGMRLRYLGDYEILGPVGYGGMGVVYKARQVSLDRIVALKMIVDRDHDRDRFKREAEAAGALDHPNIVPIHEVGEHDGWPYYSMRFLEGGDLGQWMSPPRDELLVAKTVSKLARAVHHAHRRGVLHRDLKPGNVLIDENGEPQVTDFGLAKLVDQESFGTRSGSVLGTPAYMSPEQAAGNNREITTSTDIYGLGAILYALITGRAPFDADNSLTLLRRVEKDVPIAPRIVRPEISADLNTICLKCLEKEPRLRYDSAESLADDLDRLIRGEPVHARPIAPWERVWRWSRRNPLAAASTFATACLLAVLSIGGPWLASREFVARTAAQKSRDDALVAKRQVENRMADVFTNRGQLVRLRWEWGEARLWYALAAGLSDDSEKRSANLVRAETLRQLVPQPIRATMFSGSSIRAFEFHPAGQLLLCGDLNDHFVIWNLAGYDEPLSIGTLNGVTCAHWNRDGTRLAAGTSDGSVVVLSADGRTQFWNRKLTGRICCLAWDSTGSRLAAGSDQMAGFWTIAGDQDEVSDLVPIEARGAQYLEFDQAGERLLVQDTSGVNVFDIVATGKAVPVLPNPIPHSPPKDFAHSLHPRFLHDDSFLTVEDAQVNVNDCATGQRRYTLNSGSGRSICSVSVHNETSSVFVAGTTSARLWHDGKLSQLRAVHRESVVATAIHPEGTIVATGSLDGEARLWLPQQEKPRANISHPASVVALRFSPDGELLATAQADGLVRVWRVDPGAFTVRFRTGAVATGRAAPEIGLAPDGQQWFIANCDPDQNVGRQFQMFSMTGDAAKPALELDGLYCGAAMSLDGKLLATLSVAELDSSAPNTDAEASRLQFWRWPSCEPLAKPIDLPTNAAAMKFRPDGKQLATLSVNGKLQCWDTASLLVNQDRNSQVVPQVIAEDFPEDQIADRESASEQLGNGGLLYSRDGKTLIVWNGGNAVHVWDTASRQLRYRALDHPSPCTAVAVSADENWLATATATGDVQVWDLSSGQPESPSITHAGRVNSVRFSPDGRMLLTSCEDDHVRTIDWRNSSAEHRSFNTRSDAYEAVFSPSGEWFITASDGNPCTIHDASDGQLMAYLEVPPGLTGTRPRNRHTRLTLTPDGKHVLVAGGRSSVWIHGLNWIDEVDRTDLEHLQWEAELSSGRRIVDGTATPIPSAEWLSSWREYAQRHPAALNVVKSHSGSK